MRIQKLNDHKVAVLTPVEIMRLRVMNILSIHIQKLKKENATFEAISEAETELEDVDVYFSDKIKRQNRRAFDKKR